MRCTACGRSLYVERSAIYFEKKLTSRVVFSTHVSNLPMSLHEMRPVLVPFVAPAGAMRNEKVVTYFFQKSCTWYANNLSFKTVEIN